MFLFHSSQDHVTLRKHKHGNAHVFLYVNVMTFLSQRVYRGVELLSVLQ